LKRRFPSHGYHPVHIIPAAGSEPKSIHARQPNDSSIAIYGGKTNGYNTQQNNISPMGGIGQQARKG
jgi:hypothetical protein